MGEMSDYFEDFPEQNPANYDEDGQFNPLHREESERRRIAYAKLEEIRRRKRAPGNTDLPEPPDSEKSLARQ